MNVWRRARRPWWIAGLALIVLAVAVVSVSTMVVNDKQSFASESDPGSCGISQLPSPDGEGKAQVSAVSGSGEYIVGEADDATVRWQDEEPEVIEDVTNASAVNSSGVMAGSSQEDSHPAWLYDDEVTELSSPHDSRTRIFDINDSGDVVGVAEEEDEDDEDLRHVPGYPLLWKAGSQDPVELEVESGMLANATAVTDDGDVLGYQVEKGNHSVVPWRWDSEGQGEELPPMSDDETAMPVDVAGDWVLSSTAPDGYRWKLDEPEETQKLSLDQQSVTAIDAAGTAYGLAEWGVPGRQIDDEIDELELLSDDPDGGNDGANAVDAASEDGSVLIGSSLNDDGTATAVTWSCQ